MRERTVPLTKSHTDTPVWVVSVFLTAIQKFMKPVFAEKEEKYHLPIAKKRSL